MTTIQIRIDEKVKNGSRKILESVGLDLSSGIKLFLHNVMVTKGVPLQIRTVNGYTPEYERELIESVKEAELHGKRYTDVRKMLSEI